MKLGSAVACIFSRLKGIIALFAKTLRIYLLCYEYMTGSKLQKGMMMMNEEAHYHMTTKETCMMRIKSELKCIWLKLLLQVSAVIAAGSEWRFYG